MNGIATNFFVNVIALSSHVHVRYMLSPVRPSDACLSVVCNARAPYTQPVELFGNVSTPFGTVAIHWHPRKILRIRNRILVFDWYQNRRPWMTLNGVMALVLRYFTEFVYDVVVKQLLGLPRFQNLLLIVYDHVNMICGRVGWASPL